MTDHPYPNIRDAIAARLEVEPLPAGEWKLLGAVQHAQSEPEPETTEGADQ